MAIKYITQKLAQQVRPLGVVLSMVALTSRQIDEELMSSAGAFSLDQASRPLPGPSCDLAW